MVATHNQGPRIGSWNSEIEKVLPKEDRNCYGMDPDLFCGYDGEPTSDRIFREQDAKEVCSECKLQLACLQFAIDHGERGVWGGLNDDDRRELLTGRKPKSHSARDPEGFTKQKRARADRVKIAKNLKSQGLSLDDIAREIGVTLGTVYDYFRYEGKDHGETGTDQAQASEAQAGGTRSSDSRRETSPVLSEVDHVA